MNNKGIIKLGEKVMVSDPCYGLGTWCQGVIENVLPGNYECVVEYSDEGDWGVRVAAIEVIHQDTRFIRYEAQDFEVGVDSGQAGIFDYEYYVKYHTDSKEAEHVDDGWYDKVCDLTLSRIKNPVFEEFNWDILGESPVDQWKRYKEYRDSKKCWPYLERLDGNTVDGLGLVSSSGYGDGGYTCWASKNEDGKVNAIRIEFIADEEEKYDDEDDYYEEEE